MAVAVKTSSTTTWASTSSVVITKPSGLAVGDLMLVHLAGNMNGLTITPPSGFSLIAQHVGNAAYWKIATSTDVAASDFTFGLSATDIYAGGMLRIDGQDATTPITASAYDTFTNDSTPAFGTITPAANSLIVILTQGEGSSISGVGSYAIATSNPSWTEAYELTTTLGSDFAASLAYGTRSAATATGNASWAYTTPGNNTEDGAGILLSIAPATYPNVTTQDVSSVTTTTATGNGTIVHVGTANPDIRGIVYDTASHGNPGDVAASSSAYASKVEETGGSFTAGAFTESLTSLSPSTAYFARAYAHNSAGYTYGDEVSFITPHTANSPVTAQTNPTLGEVTVWRDKILYGLDQPNTTYTQNDDVGGIWMIGQSEPQLPLINSLYFLTSATSAVPYRPWGVRMGGMYADTTNTVKVGYQDTQATATSAQYHIGTLDTVYTATNTDYAYYVTLPINCDTDAKKLFYSIRPTMSGKYSSTMGVTIYYRLDVDATSLYDNNSNSTWTELRTVTTSTTNPTTPIRKVGRNIQFKFVFTPASGFSPQLLDYTLVYEPLDQYR